MALLKRATAFLTLAFTLVAVCAPTGEQVMDKMLTKAKAKLYYGLSAWAHLEAGVSEPLKGICGITYDVADKVACVRRSGPYACAKTVIVRAPNGSDSAATVVDICPWLDEEAIAVGPETEAELGVKSAQVTGWHFTDMEDGSGK